MTSTVLSLPRISIVTPSFNQGDFLEETIDSVLSQGYTNLEYIIIDGGSSDQSVEIIRKYEKHLHYWISEKDNGHADAINKGFARSSGEIMAWLNSDDKYYPWTLATVAGVFGNLPEVEWMQGIQSWFDAQGKQTGTKRVDMNAMDFAMGHFRWIQQESVFWRRSLWNRSGASLNTNYRLMVDGELWTRFFRHAELYQAGAVLGGLRQHSERRANQYAEQVEEEMQRSIDHFIRSLEPNVQQNLISLKSRALAFNKERKKQGGYLYNLLRRMKMNRVMTDMINIASDLPKRGFLSYKHVDLHEGHWKVSDIPVDLKKYLRP